MKQNLLIIQFVYTLNLPATLKLGSKTEITKKRGIGLTLCLFILNKLGYPNNTDDKVLANLFFFHLTALQASGMSINSTTLATVICV